MLRITIPSKDLDSDKNKREMEIFDTHPTKPPETEENPTLDSELTSMIPQQKNKTANKISVRTPRNTPN